MRAIISVLRRLFGSTIYLEPSQPEYTCSKSTMETQEQCVKYVQSLLKTLEQLTLFWCLDS